MAEQKWMTEQKWLQGRGGELYYVSEENRASDRKLQLIGVACCRRLSPFNGASRLLPFFTAVEEFVDGLLTAEEFQRVQAEFEPPLNECAFNHRSGEVCASYVVHHLCKHCRAGYSTYLINFVQSVAEAVVYSQFEAGSEASWTAIDKEIGHQRVLIRDVIGNPFRPVTLNPSWRTTNVVSLAQAIYDNRQFENMSILADALEDAGCTNQEVLVHCRGEGPHTTGCWVVDLLLGKE